MMRKYYLCDAEIPSRIYTEAEKCGSVWPGCRFGLIGEFLNREQASAALESMWNGVSYEIRNNDGKIVYIDEVR